MNSNNCLPQQRLNYILFLLAFLFFAIFSEHHALAESILVVQTCKIRPYDDAVRGFKNGCSTKINNVSYYEVENNAALLKTIRKAHPNLIVAVGIEALAKVKTIKSIPIVYLMVLHPPPALQEARNITGVTMDIPPEKHLSVLHKLLPAVKRIGLLYDPRKEAAYAKRAIGLAKGYGFDLVAKEVHNSKDVPGSLEEIKGKIDLLWILPDVTVVTPDTSEFLLLFSIQNRIPIHVFSRKYLEMGALSSLDCDPFDMGVQAGEMAANILAGARVSDIADADAANPVLSVNLKVARKLGVMLQGEALQKANILR